MERREPSYPGWECKSVHPLWRTVWRGFQTLSNKVPCDPAIPCLGMDPGKTKFSRYCTPTIMATLDTLAKIQKKPECRRTGEWLKKPGSVQFSSVHFSRSVVSDSMRPHESQHTRPPCPSPTPGVHSDKYPSGQ